MSKRVPQLGQPDGQIFYASFQFTIHTAILQLLQKYNSLNKKQNQSAFLSHNIILLGIIIRSSTKG